LESLRKNLAKFIKGTDWIMMLLCLLASSFGALLVHSATLYTLTEDQVISRDTRTMLIAVALGITVAIIISLIDYELIIKIWPVIAAVALLLMVSLFFFGVGPDARSDAASNRAEAELKFRYESNFDNFVQQLNKSATLSEDFSSVFLEKLGVLAQSGLKADFAASISKFFSMISMSPEELAAFLKTPSSAMMRASFWAQLLLLTALLCLSHCSSLFPV